MSIGLGLGGLTRLTGTVGGGNTGVVLTAANLAALPGAVTNGAIYDVTSPAVRVEGVSDAWTVTGAAGGGMLVFANLAAILAMESACASVTIKDMLRAWLQSTDVLWTYSATVAASSDSGWLEAAPFTGAGLITAVTLLTGYAGGADPTAAEGWTDASVAVGGITTGEGVTIYTGTDNAGYGRAESDDVIDAADLYVVTVVDDATAVYTSGTGLGSIVIGDAYKSGTNVWRSYPLNTDVGANWYVSVGGGTDTGLAKTAGETLWCFVGGALARFVCSAGAYSSATTDTVSAPASTPAVIVRGSAPNNIGSLTTGNVRKYRLTMGG